MIKLLRFSIFLIAVFASLSVNATHNRAGEITYVSNPSNFLSITATITTYTKESSVPADRDSLEICWGWESNDVLVCEWVQRSNGNGLSLGNDIKKNLYIASHTFPGIGHYVISMTDPNRNGGILNVNPPNSDNVPFHLETTVTILNPQFNGFNNSPILYQPPIDIACVGQPFIHNPNAYDQDGDSLSYELTVPLQSVGTVVPNYSYPDVIPNPNDPTNNTISINPVTGDLTWLTPQKAGEYNIAIYIIEWRNGSPLDTMIRDMQITVLECDNEPPVIETIEELCVIAGTLIDFEVIATDPNPGQNVRLTALGGPFILDPSPAQFTPNTNAFEMPPVLRNFTWQTTCEHISDQFYSVIFKATDNYTINGDSAGLSTLKTVRIKVVGPPPEDLQAEAVDEQINLSWEKPYDCEVVEDDYFKGFSVWRRLGSNDFAIDTCDPGLDGKGYTRIDNKLFDMSGGRYVFTDFDVERGRNYCYRILGDFAKSSAGGFNFNFVESLASIEICVQLSRDIPLITNVSVEETDPSNGEIFVQWSTPNPEDLDTIQLPGPYKYEVWRAEGITNTGFSLIHTTPSYANFYEAVDTNYLDTGLNTENNAYTYNIAFYVNGETEPLGFTNNASSTFLSIASTDETNILTWDLDVPWDNSLYTIYRGNDTEPISQYDIIGTSETEEYIDNQGLVNGVEYCYYVRGEGSYNIEGILDTLINDSQRECGIPLDTIPPCPPELSITNGCEDVGDFVTGTDIINDLVWINPMNLCEETDDVVYYKVYYAPPTDSGNFQLIYTSDDSDDTTLMHNSEFGIAGCYAVTAIDTFENESAYSNIICVDNCPIYILPNAFTPNGDGSNELFIPYPYRFVERVEFNVFNIWGQLVYTTTNPDLGWDGTNLNGKNVAQGVYYYTCRVYENRVSGVTESSEILNGFIELLR